LNELVQVEGLTKHFPLEKGLIGGLFASEARFVHAVDDVTFSIQNGEIFSLVGETGCGKTTIARLILRAIDPTSGTVLFEGQDLFKASAEQMRRLRREMQIVFQNPYASLNPRWKVKDILAEPLDVHGMAKGDEKSRYVSELLETVGLEPAEQYLDRYPHEFSGGQRQRIVVARALALKPKFIVADEPVSALDVSIRAGILNLLRDLKQDLGLTYLFIAHDLSVVRYMSDRVAVMYLGKIVELASSEDLFSRPIHPYTGALMSAVPVPDPEAKRKKIRLMPDIPSPIDIPKGCRFHTRCPYSKKMCLDVEPELREVGKNHLVSCHCRDDPAIFSYT